MSCTQESKMINSVLSGLNLSILDDIHCCISRRHDFSLSKARAAFFVRHMNKQLGVIYIKAEFDVRVHSSNLTQSYKLFHGNTFIQACFVFSFIG